jgi:serine/threonine protein kinase
MYMAPERISGERYGCVSDVWSLGVALFYLATGVYPFAVDDGFFGLEEAICTDPLPPMSNRFSPACRDFMKALLRREPSERVTADRGLQHPFLGDNYWGSVAHDRFRAAWKDIAPPSSITSADVETIAAVIADQAVRYPHIVDLTPPSNGSSHLAAKALKPDALHGSPRAFFVNMTRLIAGKVTSTASSTGSQANIEHKAGNDGADSVAALAEMCTVSTTYLRDRIHQVTIHASAMMTSWC